MEVMIIAAAFKFLVVSFLLISTTIKITTVCK